MIWQKNKATRKNITKSIVVLLSFLFVLGAVLFLTEHSYADDLKEAKEATTYAASQPRFNLCFKAKTYTVISQYCILCGSFRIIFSAINNMASIIYNQVAASLTSLVAWGFIVWLTIFVLKIVSSVTAVNPSEVIGKMASQLFKVILVFAFLKVDGASIFGLLVEPVLATSFNFATSASGTSCPAASSGATTGVFTPALQASFICLIQSLQNIVGFFQGIGFYMICASWGSGILPLLPAFGPLIAGIILVITMLIITFNYALKILDTLFRLGIFCCFMPLFIAAWGFDITKAFAQKGWEMLISIAVTFVCLALAVTMAFFMFGSVFGNMNDLVTAVNADDLSAIAAFFDVTALTVVKVVIVCVFSCAIFSKAPSFGDHFAEVNWSSATSAASDGGEQLSQALDVTNKNSWVRGQMRMGGELAKSTVGAVQKVSQAYRQYKSKTAGSSPQGGKKASLSAKSSNKATSPALAGGKPTDNKIPSIPSPNSNLGDLAKNNIVAGGIAGASGAAGAAGSASGGVGSNTSIISGSQATSGAGKSSANEAAAKTAAVPNAATNAANTTNAANKVDANANANANANVKAASSDNRTNSATKASASTTPPPLSGNSTKQPLDAKGFTEKVAASKSKDRPFKLDTRTEEQKRQDRKELYYKERQRRWLDKQRRKEEAKKKQELLRANFLKEQEKREKKKKEEEANLKKAKKSDD